MKRLLVLTLLFPLFAINASANNSEKSQARVKNKSAQAQVYRHHENTWRQPAYSHNTILFKCYDSWNHRLKGKFTSEQQYFIELGGGDCQKIKRRHHRKNALRDFHQYDFPISDVRHAIDKIKRKYRLGKSKVIDTANIDAGYKTFKYTLIFKVGRHDYREFRVKHNRRNGKINGIYEV